GGEGRAVLEPRHMAGLGRGELERARGLADQLGEAEGLEVARAVVRRVGVGDVLRQHLLARAQPGEVLRHRLEQWDVVEIHRRAAALWAMADAVGILLKRRK